ncbi:MAG: hypothetical protein IV108_01175 [Burkholderiales bacterium]|nr:hypothetical protein [Burkholderiales bacterium]
MLDENAYRNAYTEVNPLQCVFERAILCRCCGCEHAIKRNIAEREAAGCLNAPAHALCVELKKALRLAAAFTFKLAHPDEPLPHTKELKLQCGGLLGVERVLMPEATGPVANIFGILSAAAEQYGSLASLPYQEIVHAIHAYEPRPRRK